MSGLAAQLKKKIVEVHLRRGGSLDKDGFPDLGAVVDSQSHTESEEKLDDGKQMNEKSKDSGDVKKVVPSESTKAVKVLEIDDEKSGDAKDSGDIKDSGDTKKIVTFTSHATSTIGETKDKTIKVTALTTNLKKFFIGGDDESSSDEAQQEDKNVHDHGDVVDASDADSAVVEDHEEHSDDSLEAKE